PGLLEGERPGGVETAVAVAVAGRDDPAPVAQDGAGSRRARNWRRRWRRGGGGAGGDRGGGEGDQDRRPEQARHAALPWGHGPLHPMGRRRASVNVQTPPWTGPAREVKRSRLRGWNRQSSPAGASALRRGARRL